MDPKFYLGISMEVLSFICLVVLLYGLKKGLKMVSLGEAAKKKIIIGASTTVFFWVMIWSSLAIVGFFGDLSTFPPRPVFVILLGIIISVGVTFTKNGRKILSVIPAHTLIYFQSFRIGVEIILWQMFLKGLLPIQMTLEGINYDILSGLLAIPAGWIISKDPMKYRWVIVAYNIIGIGLLINILVIAVLSMPLFSYFPNRPYNTIVAEFPFILLPAVLVVLAMMFHIFSLRKLAIKKEAV